MDSSNIVVEPVKRIVPSCAVISDPDECQYYWQCLLQFWNLPRSIAHFPAANPVSVERSNFPALQNDDFLAALKTDGVRHLMLLTVRRDTVEPISIMIDRTLKMYEIVIWASESYFVKGSLFDGELVWNKDQHDTLDFMVFDVVCNKGIRCVNLPYRDRLQVLHDTILVMSKQCDNIEDRLAAEDKLIAMNNLCNLRVLPKKCVPRSQVRSIWQEREFDPHRSDGIIFTKNGSGVQLGTCNDIFKWKPSHSIDVRVDTNLHVYANCNASSRTQLLFQSADGLTYELVNNRLIAAISEHLPCIIECLLVVDSAAQTVRLHPQRERLDKKSPNTLRVIEATLRNAQEMIHIDELHNILQDT